MTSGAENCLICDRQLWPEDRYCAQCGTATPGDPPARDKGDNDNDSGFSFDSPVSTIAEADRSSRRDSAIGIAVLIAIVAVIALLFVAGNDVAEDLADPEPTEEPTEAPTERADPTPTEEPTLSPEEVAALLTPTPVATAEPTPTVVPLEGLAEFVETTDLGDGWMVLVGQEGRLVATNLQTSETIELTSAVGDGFAPTFVTKLGLWGQLAPIESGVRGWGLEPWSVSEAPGTSDTDTSDADTSDADSSDIDIADIPNSVIGGDVIAVVDDPDVGLVAIAASSFGDATGRSELRAIPIATGESRSIPLADAFNTLLPELVWASLDLQSTRDAYFTDAGGAIFSWSWADGWTEVAEGNIARLFPEVAVVTDCVDPGNCETVLIDGQGEVLSQVPAEAIDGAWWDFRTRFDPDGQRLARVMQRDHPTLGEQASLFVFDLSGNDAPITLDIDPEMVESLNAALTWSPNGDYLFVDSGQKVVATEVATGEMTEVGTRPPRSSGRPGVVFLSDIVRE